jgi:iron(III) transport system ATP-binding protein
MNRSHRGRWYEHVLTCPGGTIAAVFDSRRWPRASELSVGIDPDGCVAYPESVYGAVTIGRVE